jgi:hypothetical protein
VCLHSFRIFVTSVDVFEQRLDKTSSGKKPQRHFSSCRRTAEAARGFKSTIAFFMGLGTHNWDCPEPTWVHLVYFISFLGGQLLVCMTARCGLVVHMYTHCYSTISEIMSFSRMNGLVGISRIIVHGCPNQPEPSFLTTMTDSPPLSEQQEMHQERSPPSTSSSPDLAGPGWLYF